MSTKPMCKLCEHRHNTWDEHVFKGVRTFAHDGSTVARVTREVTEDVNTVARRKPETHECPECRARHVRKLGLSRADYMKEYREKK